MRRIEAALRPFSKVLEKDGPAVWSALSALSAREADAVDERLLGLLGALTELDRVGDELASWAVRREGERPDAAVDAAVAEVGRRLEELGVAREERRPPPGARSRG